MRAAVERFKKTRLDYGLHQASFFAFVFVVVACNASKVLAYTGSCQPTTTVVFKRVPGSFEMKAELHQDKSLYTIRPLSAEDRADDIILDHFSRKYKNPHILIRSPLRTMLCENTGIRKLRDLDNKPYTLPPLITCDYPYDSFELNIGSSRFVHSRLGDATDTEENIARVGKADSFMEFGKCTGQ